MLHPPLDQEKKHLAQFRKSMKKFKTTLDHTFSVKNYSKPFEFARLNSEIVSLLWSLGITSEKLLAKQDEYFEWIEKTISDLPSAVDFLSCMAQDAFDPLTQEEGQSLVALAIRNGLSDPKVARKLESLRNAELRGWWKEGWDGDNKKFKSRMFIHKSRRLLGVCDPFQVLKEGEVFIRITTRDGGPSTPINADVIVIKNPCLHPGQ
jgi:hypothetical protein